MSHVSTPQEPSPGGAVAPPDSGARDRPDRKVAPRDSGAPGPARSARSARTVGEARERIESTRERLAATAEQLKRRMEVEKGRMERRLDIASRLRKAIAGKELWALGAAFAGGLALAWLRRKARLEADDLRALRTWNEDRERVLAALELLEEED